MRGSSGPAGSGRHSPAALFGRFPGLRLAIADDEIRKLPVMTQNDMEAFPVLLNS
ncbi:hypothetical protein [Streptomyces sp. NPDC056796]|uniref:hypothetical protein n=1 Tax=Streptomyces sp. NPDC056796 TaxID=3345947 RepID=UPI0036C70FDB